MKDTARLDGLAPFTALTAAALVFACASGDDDDDGTGGSGWTYDNRAAGGSAASYNYGAGRGGSAGTYNYGAGSGVTAGTGDSGAGSGVTTGTAARGAGSGVTAGTGDSGAGSGGTAGTAAIGAGSGGSAGKGGSGGTAPKNIPEGNPCVIRVTGDIPQYGVRSGEANGVCKKPSDPCPGGTADDLAFMDAIPPEALREIEGFGVNVEDIVSIPPAQANCADGLVCCIDTGECVSIGKQVMEVAILSGRIESVGCVDEGTCTGQLVGEMDVGCPEGKTCCTEVAPY